MGSDLNLGAPPLRHHPERTSASGEPEIVVDNRPGLDDATDTTPTTGDDGVVPRDEQASAGCGCTTGGLPELGWIAWLPLALAMRRRQ